MPLQSTNAARSKRARTRCAPLLAALSIAMCITLDAALAQPAGPTLVPPGTDSPLASNQQAFTLGTVEFRGTSATVEAPVEASSAGLLIRTRGPADLEPPQLVAWHRIRAVRGVERTALAPAWAEISGQLMRAVARIERGDDALAAEVAEPLLSRLLAQGELRGPTGLVLCEVVTRARLARNGQAGATLAWLRWRGVAASRSADASIQAEGTQRSTEAQRDPVWVGHRTALGPIIDERTGLCPQLPPVLAPGVSIQALTAMLTSPEWPSTDAKTINSATGSAREAAIIALAYRAAALFEATGSAGPEGEGVAQLAEQRGSEGVSLVLDMVASRVAEPKDREAARRRMGERLAVLRRDDATSEIEADEAPIDRGWQQAWLHLALGCSLLREDDAATRRRGLVELLHVPALFQVDHPALAAMALKEVRSHASGLGLDAAAIAAIERELKEGLGLGDDALTPLVPPPSKEPPSP